MICNKARKNVQYINFNNRSTIFYVLLLRALQKLRKRVEKNGYLITSRFWKLRFEYLGINMTLFQNSSHNSTSNLSLKKLNLSSGGILWNKV